MVVIKTNGLICYIAQLEAENLSLNAIIVARTRCSQPSVTFSGTHPLRLVSQVITSGGSN
jgi:hypothetical protein